MSGEQLVHRRLRAPREHGETLIEPPLDIVPRVFAANRPWLDQLGGEANWRKLSDDARASLFSAGTYYTRQYRNVAMSSFQPALPILLAGHQPELFHPGVWFKNFLLSSLAANYQAAAINLIVDNDAIDLPAIRVPAGDRESPRVETVAIDSGSEGIPYEERTILDDALFDAFDARVRSTVASWVSKPLVDELWANARLARAATSNLGQVLAAARHSLEGQWGLNTLEVPLSTVVSQAPFAIFAASLLKDARRFAEVYNSSLAEYRQVNRVRSRAHPVPDLEQDDNWQEAALWIWTVQHPRRKRLFVRRRADILELTDREGIHETLPARSSDAPEALRQLETRGIKIRPRALLTTMYARLVLSDLFIHGIGGAKYDELTDAIIRRYFGSEPPAYLTATATVQLPLDYPRTTADAVQHAQHEARELPYHAEQELHDGVAQELITRKQELLREIPPRGAKRRWHQAMSEVNESLYSLVGGIQQQLNERVAAAVEEQRITKLLGSREFSCCLFPADFLRTLLLDLSRDKA